VLDFFDGLQLGASSKSAYVSLAAKEMAMLAIEMGAKPSSFAIGSHAWLSDLLTTSFGSSRNRSFGEYIGMGLSVEEALNKLKSQKR